MDTREAFQLLTLASARDGRTVDVEVASVWADDLAGVSLLEGAAAIRDHYRATTKWIMPADIVGRVKAARNDSYQREPIESGTGVSKPANYDAMVEAARVATAAAIASGLGRGDEETKRLAFQAADRARGVS